MILTIQVLVLLLAVVAGVAVTCQPIENPTRNSPRPHGCVARAYPRPPKCRARAGTRPAPHTTAVYLHLCLPDELARVPVQFATDYAALRWECCVHNRHDSCCSPLPDGYRMACRFPIGGNRLPSRRHCTPLHRSQDADSSKDYCDPRRRRIG